MKVYDNVLEMVGNTPMLKFHKMNTGKCQLFGKLESQNPGASIKDRIAISMIETAEKEGHIKPGDTLIEATAGNTGLGLAMVASQKGYKLKIVMPDKMSMEKEYNLRAFGAEVMRTRSDVGKGHPEYYQDVAKRLSEENGWYFINQFSNPANIAAHYMTTGPEIWEQLDGKVDAVVLGVGSGGTVTGIGRFLKEKNPDIDIVLADPDGSILTHYHETGEMSEAGSWVIEGIGEDFIPDICDMSLFTKAYTVTDKESLNTARELMLKESVMGGSSTGTLVAAALKYCQDQTEPKNVVTFVCDTGNRYLSKMYNDEWMKEQGFLDD
ncbi:PLP-dependent cysteine synthase family protein [Kangiella sediminilitoris]|uniref:Cysteine synthase B n=1 Tax=Kangiella sediminilitoris TaxID=1144748 RepID=A0A1B3B9G3_9GAMM|nr:PLP-dependent cysteine synthase family protein [Kangiella sediminilitoris]AOE49444.1 Pyridoxal-5'-phosphate-dependent protein beta subunit [Kangiella sediminilitoris]